MLFTCARSIHINTDRKQLKQVLHFRFSFEPSFPKLTSLSFSLRPSVLRHVMYTIVDRYYMTMKERLGASLCKMLLASLSKHSVQISRGKATRGGGRI